MLNSRQAKILANITASAANAENPYQSIRRELNRTPLLPLDREVLKQQLAFLYGEEGPEVPPLPEPLPSAKVPTLYTSPLVYENRAAHTKAWEFMKPIPVLNPMAPKHERQKRQEQEDFRTMLLRREELQGTRNITLARQTPMLPQQTKSTTTRRRTIRRKRIQ